MRFLFLFFLAINVFAISEQDLIIGEKEIFSAIPKPIASLTASPGDTTFTSKTLEVIISTDNGNTIYYTTDGRIPDTTDLTQLLNGGSSSGTITIMRNTTLNAIAIGSNYESSSASWEFARELPQATLTASVGDTTYYKTSLDVELSSEPGNTIVYELFDADSQRVSGPDTLSSSGTVTIVGDMILTATASGDGFLDADNSWEYDSELPHLRLVSSLKSGSAFEVDTLLYLFSVFDGDTIDSEIYYVIDYDGSLSFPDSTTGTLYTPSAGITLSKSATLYAIAYKRDYIEGIGTWNYDQELVEILSFRYDESTKTTPVGVDTEHDFYIVNKSNVDKDLTVSWSYVSLPDNWNISVCLDLCFAPFVTTTDVTVPAGEEKELQIHVIPAGSGTATMQFDLGETGQEPSTSLLVTYPTSDNVALSNSATLQSPASLLVFDNQLSLSMPSSGYTEISLIQSNGRTVQNIYSGKYESNQSLELSTAMIATGIYYLKIEQGNTQYAFPLHIQ